MLRLWDRIARSGAMAAGVGRNPAGDRHGGDRDHHQRTPGDLAANRGGAERVAQIAEQTVLAAGSGEAVVDLGRESLSAIRRQVDVIVSHMPNLGKRSQQIGSILDVVSELAEQTNILAINATIEAVGAGEAGKRFGVVADEIRKLADRVATSAKEIRGLVEDVRAAVNTTVMTTETESKAVDARRSRFGEVANAFRQIAIQVATSTEAAREIGLSTKQQASAVEQVNVAIMSCRSDEGDGSKHWTNGADCDGAFGPLRRAPANRAAARRDAPACRRVTPMI